jgi:hypothetical protein
MPNHWTYKDFRLDEDLSQGDIIARAPPILAILDKIHSYFCNSKYLSFVILTQSCDLVMRGGACKARQIGLGVVRALDEILPDTLAELCGTAAPGVYRQDARIAAQQFLERVINQNEQGHGFFYLHPDADVGIAVPAVAMLRVSIALRSREHYNVLKAARCGRLGAEFRNKLGWLTGNLYSRVDTPDWADNDGGQEASRTLIASLLNGVGEQNVWLPDSWLQAARAKRIDLAKLPRDQVYATLLPLAPPPPLAAALDRVKSKATQLLAELGESHLQRIPELARNDEVCALLAAQAALAVARKILGPEDGRLLALLDDMPPDRRLKDSLATQVAEAVRTLRARRGPREIAILLDLLAETAIFAQPAIDCACDIVGTSLGESFAGRRDAFAQELQATKMAGPFVARLRGMIRETVDEGMVERLMGRLENDGQFKAALK